MTTRMLINLRKVASKDSDSAFNLNIPDGKSWHESQIVAQGRHEEGTRFDPFTRSDMTGTTV